MNKLNEPLALVFYDFYNIHNLFKHLLTQLKIVH